jgi:hypothetical protein
MQLHDKQRTIASSLARFKVIRAGRKGGKTAMEVENICYKAMIKAEELGLAKTTFPTGRKVIYIAPTQIQAREIVWAALKNRLYGIGTPNEQKLHMVVPNEDGTTSTIMVGGYENRENYRGLTDVVHITFDETDTFKNFFIAWQDIFRPLFLDTAGTCNFIGTPKKENPNLRRLEKESENKPNWECFHFTSRDNPHIRQSEIDEMEKEYEGNRESYRQEVLAEHIDNTGALFSYPALLDVFTNTIDRTTKRYMIVDVAGDGSDRCVFSFWEGLVEYKRLSFDRLNSSSIREKIREFAASDRIPFSHIVVDAVGVGEHLPHDPLLDGIIGFKSSYAAIKTDQDIVRLPNVKYVEKPVLVSDYKNLRSQCIFTLADLVNNHKIASEVTGDAKEKILEELPLYQDASTGDGKRFATPKEDVKEMLGRSPDDSDTWIMRMYFEVMGRMLPHQSEARARMVQEMQNNRLRTRNNQSSNSAR